jgi:hypothetical protein
MRDHRLQRAGPARLRMDAYPIGHRIRLLVDQYPWRIARKAMAGVIPGRLTERELLGNPIEDIAAVAYPVRPWDEILAPTGFAHLLDAEAANHVAAVG